MPNVTLDIKPGHESFILAYNLTEASLKYEHAMMIWGNAGDDVDKELKADAELLRRIAKDIARQTKPAVILQTIRQEPESLTGIEDYVTYSTEPRREKMDSRMEGFIRHVLTSIGGAGVIWGVVDEQTVVSVVGAAMTLFGFIWSMQAKAKVKP